MDSHQIARDPAEFARMDPDWESRTGFEARPCVQQGLRSEAVESPHLHAATM